MPVFRWGRSWNPLDDLEREVDRLLRGVNLTFQGIRLGRQYPPINLYELADEYLLVAEVPGTKNDDLDLSVAGGVLTIRGKRGGMESVPEDRFRRQERFHGSWQRGISIPDRVREEGLRAELTNGILKIHLPKAETARPRSIPVVGE